MSVTVPILQMRELRPAQDVESLHLYTEYRLKVFLCFQKLSHGKINRQDTWSRERFPGQKPKTFSQFLHFFLWNFKRWTAPRLIFLSTKLALEGNGSQFWCASLRGVLYRVMPAFFKGLSSQHFIIKLFKYTNKLKGL